MTAVILTRPDRVLRLASQPDLVLVSTTTDPNTGRVRWLAPVLGRYGKAHTFHTQEQALAVAARQCGLTIVECRGPLKERAA